MVNSEVCTDVNGNMVATDVEETTFALYENDEVKISEKKSVKIEKPLEEDKKPKLKLVWRNVFLMVLLHTSGIIGIILLSSLNINTILWAYIVMLFSSLGVQAGAHRLWTHRTYEANYGLRVFLSICHVIALQNDLYEWARDHRVHHKFSDTDADPHNSSRGFFFSHVGWLMVKKHPDVIRRGRTIDLSDLEADPIVMFQKKYYIPLVGLLWGAFPTLVPVFFWGENIILSGLFMMGTRYMLSLNFTWLVNSWAHIYGTKPYDHRLGPVEASIRHILMGEGFHNYHHAFPWDYSASELGAMDVFNPATAAINFFQWMGWAKNLKRADPEMVKRRMKSTGDLSNAYKPNRGLYEWLGGISSLVFLLLIFLYIHKH